MPKQSFPPNRYPNIFARLGYSPAAIEARTQEIFMTLFYGDENQRLYHIVGPDMACFEDTGNHDVRTEGMSYAMMMCVQMNRKIEFDRLWKWAYVFGQRPQRGIFCLELRSGREQKRLGSRAGWRGILCDGAFFRRSPVGERRGDF